jgi:hypothetical protein
MLFLIHNMNNLIWELTLIIVYYMFLLELDWHTSITLFLADLQILNFKQMSKCGNARLKYIA